jgi:glucans biosynthesis protein
LKIKLYLISLFSLVFILVNFIFLNPSESAEKTKTKQGKSGKPDASFFQKVIKTARELANQPYQGYPEILPEVLTSMSYDQWRKIRFKPENSLWRDKKLRFEVQFFHSGYLYNFPVRINEITSEGTEQVAFNPEFFEYGSTELKKRIPLNAGYAGFRIHYYLKSQTYKDEVVAFLGASYFRAVGKDQQYGLSARGLSVDTALPTGEEFPYFREFWLKKPTKTDKNITVFALLESPRLDGAYRFIIRPGTDAIMEVDAVIFRRNNVNKIGIAPMTSMFFYGENTNIRPLDDFRPENHDSDGLMISFKTGEWLWRPLINPQALLINSFQADSPSGFGLMQRDLDFDHYQDPETRYDLRPSLWVVPSGEWGSGAVELVQIPSENHYNDNIVAFWRPDAVPAADEPYTYSYSLYWQFPAKNHPPEGRVIATRYTTTDRQNTLRFLVDFKGGELDKLQEDDAVEAAVTLDSEHRLIDQQVFRIQPTGTWRLVFQVEAEDNPTLVEKVIPARKKVVELRAFLRRGKTVLTETWSYGARF